MAFIINPPLVSAQQAQAMAQTLRKAIEEIASGDGDRSSLNLNDIAALVDFTLHATDTTGDLIPLPIPTKDDLAHLLTCDSSVRKRRLVEIAIIRHACQEIVAAGYRLAVDDGDAYQAYEQDVELAVQAVIAVDEARLHVLLPKQNKLFGWIFFVLGNDGWDVICDNTVNLEPLLEKTTAYADALSAWF